MCSKSYHEVNSENISVHEPSEHCLVQPEPSEGLPGQSGEFLSPIEILTTSAQVVLKFDLFIKGW